MKRGFWFKTIRVLIVITVAVSIAGLLMVFRPRAERQVRADNGRLVEVIAVSPESRRMSVQAFGTVRPKETLHLVAQVPGRIVETAPDFLEGGFASANTLLIRIDPRSYALEVERRRVQTVQIDAELGQLAQEVENLGARIRIAQSDTALAEAEFIRLKTLAGKNVVARTALDQAEQRHLASRERLQALTNQLATTGPAQRQIEARRAMAQVGQAQAELDLERTRVVSPFDGWVLEKKVEKGQHVHAGQVLGSLYRAGALEVTVQIPVQELQWLDLSASSVHATAAEVRFAEGGQAGQWPGRVSRVKASMDAGTRTLPVVVDIDTRQPDADPGRFMAMRPGMFVTVRIGGVEKSGLFVLPRHAMRSDDTVYVAADHRLAVRSVGVLRYDGESVYVDRGLAPGDRVIVSPLSDAVDGMKIRVKKSGGRLKVEG
jgi:membrane fusion protein, multidrug efflux system